MSNIIFYFTGTGNSLSVARDIADKIGDTKVVSISDAMRESSIDVTFERIGFVFPVYFISVPAIVKQFIKKLEFSSTSYIFGVITYGGSFGIVLSQLGQLIAQRGGIINAGFSVLMPGNYINKYSAFPKTIQRILLKRAKKRANNISAMVKAKNTTRIPKGSLLSRHYEESVNKIIADFGNMAVNYHTTEKCNGCGICQRICPVGNIKMEGAQPKWGNTCEQCVACIQWCPKQAIEYADKTAKRIRYHHPEVRISDLIPNSQESKLTK